VELFAPSKVALAEVSGEDLFLQKLAELSLPLGDGRGQAAAA
jgi:hypothetical protein